MCSHCGREGPLYREVADEALPDSPAARAFVRLAERLVASPAWAGEEA